MTSRFNPMFTPQYIAVDCSNAAGKFGHDFIRRLAAALMVWL
jgi:hypothetical protein